MRYPHEVNVNAGRNNFAGLKHLFGPFGRYAVQPMMTRFGELIWFVTDADQIDEYDLPAVIRQSPVFADAVAGLSED